MRLLGFVCAALLTSATGSASQCLNDFCKGARHKPSDFHRYVKRFGLHHLMTFDPGVKGQPVGEVYVKLRPAAQSQLEFDKFYVFVDWQDHLRDPVKYPSRDHDDIDVEDILTMSDMKSPRTLMKMDKVTVISSKFREWLAQSQAGFVIDLRVLAQYNVVFSNDYSTRQIAFDIVGGQPRAYYRDKHCNKDRACKGVPFDYVWTRLRSGRIADYIGIRSMVFYDSKISKALPVAKTNL